MAAKGVGIVTLADVAKSKNKQIGKVAEVLVKQNPMLNDIPYVQMNQGTIHTEDIRSGLPEVYYRKVNQAIPASKTTTEERSYQAAHFESKSQMDEKAANRGGASRVAYNRWNQATGHIQAMGQEHAKLAIYGSPVSSNLKTPGFMDYYATLNVAEEASKQIVDFGGTGSDNTSILLVHWGINSVFGVYPEGESAGLKRIDRSKGGMLVQILGQTAAGNPGTYYGYEEQFEIDHGLVIKDFRQASRGANIDVLNLKSGTNAADLIDLMISMAYTIDNPENGQGVWYVNRTIEAHLHKQSLTKVGAGAGLTYDNYQGKRILTFLGMPIRRSDTLLNSETRVV